MWFSSKASARTNADRTRTHADKLRRVLFDEIRYAFRPRASVLLSAFVRADAVQIFARNSNRVRAPRPSYRRPPEVDRLAASPDARLAVDSRCGRQHLPAHL